jgi:hypothetical protein
MPTTVHQIDVRQLGCLLSCFDCTSQAGSLPNWFNQLLDTLLRIRRHRELFISTGQCVQQTVRGRLVEDVSCLMQSSQARCSHTMRTDLSSIVPMDFRNVMPESCGLKSDNGRFKSSWKKNCASSKRARSTDSLPACIQHKLWHKGADVELRHFSLQNSTWTAAGVDTTLSTAATTL